MQSLSNGAATTTGTVTDAEILQELSKLLQERALETPFTAEGVELGTSSEDVNADGSYDKAFAELWELCTSSTTSTAGSFTATPIPPVLPGLQPAPALFPNISTQRPVTTATSAALHSTVRISSPAPARHQRPSPHYARGSRVQGGATTHLSQPSEPLPVVPRSANNGGLPTHANHPQPSPGPSYRQPDAGRRPIIPPVIASHYLTAARPATATQSSPFRAQASAPVHSPKTDTGAVPRSTPVPAASVPRQTAPPVTFPLLQVMRDTDRPGATRISLELAEQTRPAPQRASVLRPARCTIDVKAPAQKKRSGTKRKASAVDAGAAPHAKKKKVTRKTKQEQPTVVGPGPRTLALQEASGKSDAEISSAPSGEETSHDPAHVLTNDGSSSESVVLGELVKGLDVNAFDELLQLLG